MLKFNDPRILVVFNPKVIFVTYSTLTARNVILSKERVVKDKVKCLCLVIAGVSTCDYLTITCVI